MDYKASRFRKRVMIVADSMAMPRPGVSYESTWVHLLLQEFQDIEFIDRCKRGSLTTRLVNEGGALGPYPAGSDVLELYTPDIVILQLGLVDASPRYYKKRSLEGYLVDRFMTNALRGKYLTTIKKIRDRKPDYTDTSIEEFGNVLHSYFKRAAKLGTKVIGILMADVPQRGLAKTPHAGTNLANYNKVYIEVASHYPDTVRVIGPLTGIGPEIDDLTIDEFHLNDAGNKMVFKALKPMLEQELAATK